MQVMPNMKPMITTRPLLHLPRHVQLAAQIKRLLFYPLVVETQALLDQCVEFTQELADQPFRNWTIENFQCGFLRNTGGKVQGVEYQSTQKQATSRRGIFRVIVLGKDLDHGSAWGLHHAHEVV